MKKRLDYVDYARGVGVILMLIGHLGFGDGVYKVIYSFHMPLFFLISGYILFILAITVDLPATSLIRNFLSLPTKSGDTCSKDFEFLYTPSIQTLSSGYTATHFT